MSLIPCSSCQRHVKSNESMCPFCEARLTPSVSAAARPARRSAVGRLAFVGGASIAVACTVSTTPVYGAPGTDDSNNPGTGAAGNAPDDGSGGLSYAAPVYGTAPVTGGGRSYGGEGGQGGSDPR